MNELLGLQEQFQEYLVSGKPGIESSIVATEWVSVETRLGIYREAYKLRLIESLTTNFPALHLYLGTEQFEVLCTAYLDDHPSTFRSIRWYGNLLAEFVHHFFDTKYSYLAELAEFEWNMTLVFDAADDRRVVVEDMASVPPESWAGLQFSIHPSVQRVNCFWNAIPLWSTLINNQDIPEMERQSKATPWILWRNQEYLTKFYSMSEVEAWALDAVGQGLSFGELCEGLCQWIQVEDVAMRAASFLKAWIQNGMISKLHSNSPGTSLSGDPSRKKTRTG